MHGVMLNRLAGFQRKPMMPSKKKEKNSNNGPQAVNDAEGGKNLSAVMNLIAQDSEIVAIRLSYDTPVSWEDNLSLGRRYNRRLYDLYVQYGLDTSSFSFS